MNNNKAGKLAEIMAQIYMMLHGYQIVASNVLSKRGTHCGEVDFIARRGKTLVFIEVKKRGSLDKAAYAIRLQQQQRIRNGALNFIKRNLTYQNYDIRFDAILIAFPFSIRHIVNAWQ